MKRESFYKFYDNVIQTVANNLVALDTNFRFNNNKESLYASYQEQKTFFRMLCNKTTHNPDDRKDLLDRHKVCASMLAAINNANLLVSLNEVNEPENLQQLNKINVQFSISVTLRLLSLFIVNDNTLDDEYKQYFQEGSQYIFPEVSSENEEYEDTLIRSLALSKYTNHMDLPLIAHILFLLEKFHVATCSAID